ncbi:MAG TPA: hypothetical protein VE981_11535 [Planctomycetota bacterium]|nr:hypothetical protein [Planctomycetota bacterium]
MKYSLLILPFLASTLAAQDDIWKNLAKGDRVQLTFRSGNMITGQIANRPADPRLPQDKLDLSQASEVTLDVSLEYPGLNGTLTILRKEVKEIRKLQNLDAATEKRIREEIQRIQQQSSLDEALRRQQEADRDMDARKAREAATKIDKSSLDAKAKGEAAVKDFDDIQKGLDLLKRFPPDKWGPQVFSQVADKATLKIPVTPDERDFMNETTYKLWQKGLEYQKSLDAEKNKDKEKDKEPEKKTETKSEK